MTNAAAFQRARNKAGRLQELLGVTSDGFPGPNTYGAFLALRRAALDDPDGEWLSAEEHRTMASSFADPADVAAFRDCKAEGHSDKYCFRYGDNGETYWGDNSAQTVIAMVALPPEDMIERWGSIEAARHKPVIVRANGRECHAILAEMMPSKKNIENGAGLDMNPATCKALRLSTNGNVMVPAVWRWG